MVALICLICYQKKCLKCCQKKYDALPRHEEKGMINSLDHSSGHFPVLLKEGNDIPRNKTSVDSGLTSQSTQSSSSALNFSDTTDRSEQTSPMKIDSSATADDKEHPNAGVYYQNTNKNDNSK